MALGGEREQHLKITTSAVQGRRRIDHDLAIAGADLLRVRHLDDWFDGILRHLDFHTRLPIVERAFGSPGAKLRAVRRAQHSNSQGDHGCRQNERARIQQHGDPIVRSPEAVFTFLGWVAEKARAVEYSRRRHNRIRKLDGNHTARGREVRTGERNQRHV
eukprot:scaffold3327_cov242-Pinguiococcus_pyrenoidosus.AAC.1